jgi:beta-galactosidase/beta-glucuronidase
LAGHASVRFSLERNSSKSFEAEVAIGPELKLWDEFSPHLYTLDSTVEDSHDEPERVAFGMRKLSIRGKQFVLNGRPLMLRGTLECGIFPLTGYLQRM